MKVRWLLRDPIQKAGDAGMRAKRGGITLRAGKLHIAHLRVDRTMTDWMNGRGFTPAPAFRHRMMPFDALAKRTRAEPA